MPLQKNAIFCAAVLAAASPLFLASAADDVTLEDFSNPAHQWQENNDPVMGGESTGTTTVSDDLLIFNGTVVDVPFLKAPGFITTQTRDDKTWADVSHCKALALEVKSNTNYSGYRVSFGEAKAYSCKKFFAYGYKAPFDAPTPLGTFGRVVIPFSDFSDCWDDATGDIITTCADDERFCPTEKALSDLETISIWGEGVGGDVHLEVKSISGTDCSTDVDKEEETTK